MPRLGFRRGGGIVHAPPGADQALHLRGGAGLREGQQRLVGRRGHAGERADLGVGNRAALHGGADERKRRQRVRHAHLLAGGTEVDAGSPVQPVRARREPAGPARALVELAQQHQQLVGGGMQPHGQRGDLIAESLGGVGAGRGDASDGTRDERRDESGGRHIAIVASQKLPRQIGPRASIAARSACQRGPSVDRASSASAAPERPRARQGRDNLPVAFGNVSSAIARLRARTPRISLRACTGQPRAASSNRHATPHSRPRAVRGRHDILGRARPSRRSPGARRERRLSHAVRERLGPAGAGALPGPTPRFRCTATRPR